ncbi:MAG: hypothetical protein ACYDCQ_19190 [Dehalococcoidia bacterium]
MAPPKNDLWLAQALDWLEASAFPLTLFVNGMVVTGEAISQAAYYRALGDQLGGIAERAGSHEAPIRSYFVELADESEAALDARRARLAEQAATMPLPADRTPEQYATLQDFLRDFIHLHDVTVMMNSGATLNVQYWRGQLCEVTGWCLGRAEIGQSRYEDPTRL